MTLVDLRIEFKKETGKGNVPLSHDHYFDVEYIMWLEEKLLRLKELKKKLIPFENEL